MRHPAFSRDEFYPHSALSSGTIFQKIVPFFSARYHRYASVKFRYKTCGVREKTFLPMRFAPASLAVTAVILEKRGASVGKRRFRFVADTPCCEKKDSVSYRFGYGSKNAWKCRIGRLCPHTMRMFGILSRSS